MAIKLINKTETIKDDIVYIMETYQSDKTGKESVVKYPKPSEVTPEPVEPEPTQLDRIQQAVEKSNDELRQEGAEAVTLELIERGVL